MPYQKYTRIDELTPEILNSLADKTLIHVRGKKDGKRTQEKIYAPADTYLFLSYRV
ncbi:DUF4368 domain-containing protein [Lachnospiraceae bacterium]|nr:DUF4368 domain-containing protein [Lachnospiraceae bacterium]